MPWYFLALFAVYFLGSAVYALLNALGFGAYGQASSMNFIESVAAGAPDIADQLAFMTRWLADPVYSDGRTFVGGLVPGNYEWNPSVWTLSITNPGVDVAAISSGGYRLPPQVWGMVSFGWVGVFAVSLLYGWALGRLTRTMRQVIPSDRIENTVALFVVIGAAMDLFTRFYAMSYIMLVQLAAVLFAVGVVAAAGGNLPGDERNLTQSQRGGARSKLVRSSLDRQPTAVPMTHKGDS